MLCVFNLSAEAVTVSVSGTAGGLEPLSRNATLTGKSLALGPNGFAFLSATAKGKVA
jgi:alpha-glucosidase